MHTRAHIMCEIYIQLHNDSVTVADGRGTGDDAALRDNTNDGNYR